MELYTLTICERTLKARAQLSLIGPFLFARKEIAMDCLIEYVSHRIQDTCLDRLLEKLDQFALNINPAIKPDQLTQVIEQLTKEQRHHIVDWYFEHNDGVTGEGCYKIDAHAFPLLENFIPYLNEYINEEVSEGEPLSLVTKHSSLQRVAEKFLQEAIDPICEDGNKITRREGERELLV